MTTEPIAVTLLVIEALDDLGVRYVIGGSLASAEDTILAKLDWYRQGGEVSERQWRDVLGVVRVQGDRLEWSYLRQQAASLGLSDLLEKLQSAAL
jgi:hypothetical protein